MLLETKDIYLDKGKFEDWKDMYRNIWSRDESARYMLWKVSRSEEEARDRMRKTIEWQKTHDAYFIYEKAGGHAIGFAGFTEVEPGVFEDTGVAFGPEYVGKGYGKQLLPALVAYCFEERGGEKFICSSRSKNTASKRLALSCGFTYTHSQDRVDARNGESYVVEFFEKRKE